MPILQDKQAEEDEKKGEDSRAEAELEAEFGIQRRVTGDIRGGSSGEITWFGGRRRVYEGFAGPHTGISPSQYRWQFYSIIYSWSALGPSIK